MSSTALTTIQPQEQAIQQQGGMGLDFSSRLFQLKPATININQQNTTVEGAVKGKLRISETGDQFDHMYVTLLTMPTERRDFHTGEPGQLNRSSDNLMCFSRNVIRDIFNKELQGPDSNARVPQALKCDGCPKASWEKWRQTKRKEDIPPCDLYYYAMFIDTVYKMPLQMYIRSKSKAPFEAGMQNLARTFAKLKSTGANPNIFDIRFKLSTKQIITNKLPSYILDLSDFKVIDDNDRAAFGDMYLQFVNRNKRNPEQQTEADAATQIEDANAAIEGEIVEPGTTPTEEAITI